jgi:phenylacetate-CoA ligase
MKKTFMPLFNTEKELESHQLNGLKWTVNHVYNGSEFYRKRFIVAGIKPNDINLLDDLKKFPFTTADDLKVGYPLPLLSVLEDKIIRIHASSGTTGKKKILSYTEKDIDDWTNMFARCYEMAGVTEKDKIQIAVGYGLWTAGISFQLGCERLGATAIPIGPGNIDMQCEFLIDMQSTVMCCTASMALLMAEEIEKRGIKNKIALKKIIFGSERSSDSMRKRIKKLMGIEEMFDITGLTELYGPGTGIECSAHEGIHYWADKYILEILDPDTLMPVKTGEIGEMVVTTLSKEAAPLIRYRTRDLTRAIEHRCSCGSILPMHDRILGRSDDMIIYRAVNIYPGQIDHALSSFSEIGSEYQVILDRKDDGKDYMTLKVEARRKIESSSKPDIAQKISKYIKKKIMVSCNVEVCDYGSLPRSERKTQRIFDNRP